MNQQGYALFRIEDWFVEQQWPGIPPLVELLDDDGTCLVRVHGASVGWTDGTYIIESHTYPVDDFYGTVIDGVYTPYPPAQMKAKLKDYSANQRYQLETSGLALTLPATGPVATMTTRDVRSVYTDQAMMLDKSSRKHGVKVKLLKGGNTIFADLDKNNLEILHLSVQEFVDNCTATEEQVSKDIDSGAVRTTEQIDAVYNSARTVAGRVSYQ